MLRRCRSAGGLRCFLVRPLLHLPKARLVATLKAERIGFSEDPSNRDPRFTRARLRGLMPGLAREGLDARGLSPGSRRGCGAPKPRSNLSSGRHARRWRRALGRSVVRSHLRQRGSPICRPKWLCVCSAARWPMPATRGRSNLVNSKRSTMRSGWPLLGCGGRSPGPRSRSTKTGSPSSALRPGGAAPSGGKAHRKTGLKGRFTN